MCTVTKQSWSKFSRRVLNRGNHIIADSPNACLSDAHRIYGRHLTFNSTEFETALKAHRIEPKPFEGIGFILELCE